jgi:hypothetical protein
MFTRASIELIPERITRSGDVHLTPDGEVVMRSRY